MYGDLVRAEAQRPLFHFSLDRLCLTNFHVSFFNNVIVDDTSNLNSFLQPMVETDFGPLQGGGSCDVADILQLTKPLLSCGSNL